MSIARDAAPAAAPPASAAARRASLVPRTRGERSLAALGLATAVGMVASIWAIFGYAPEDQLSGVVQRIFYFHVPVAWDAYLAFFIVFVASIVYLWRRDERWDWLARAAAEIGTVLTTLVLITGSLWGKPVWGAWWRWEDARLTTTLILWFIYVGYLMLRSYTGRSASGARAAAVLGIVGFVDVPINYLSVTLWNRIHPYATYVVDQGKSALPPAALTAFMLSLATWTLFLALLLVLVYHLERLQARLAKAHALLEG